MPDANCRVDLHVHTDASDGAFSPDQLLEEAKWNGVSAVAITDHDTFSGVAAAQAAGRKHGIEVVPGVELSCRHAGEEVHLVGLLIEPDQGFLDLMEHLRACRESRMDKMLANLRGLGFVIDKEELGVRPGQSFGRPHLARALVRRGIVRNVGEAFERYLGDGGPVDVERERLEVAEGLALIHRVHGVSIVAHPGVSGLEGRLDDFRALGAMGMETRYPQYSPEMEQGFAAYCEKHGMLQSGGSDFHSRDRNSALGVPFVPYEFLTKMKEKKERLWPGSSAGSKKA